MAKVASLLSIAFALTVLSSPGFAQPTEVLLGTVSQFSGPGDLDLDGEFVRAVNFNGPDLTVNDVTFLSDAGDPEFIGPQNVVAWQNRPDYGASQDEDNLEQIMHDIRWSNNGAGEFLEAHISDVVVGQQYKLQILISGNHEELRVWDIEVEGMEAVDGITSLGLDTDTYDPGSSMVYTHSLVAQDTTFDVRMGQLFGGEYGDDLNAIWQALTLEAVGDIIEPTADFNMDGVVDEKDYFILNDHLYAHLDQVVSLEDGDFNLDGAVDLVDFGMFKDEFPQVVAAALATVPEPSSLTLLVTAVLGLFGLSRRRRSSTRSIVN